MCTEVYILGQLKGFCFPGKKILKLKDKLQDIKILAISIYYVEIAYCVKLFHKDSLIEIHNVAKID